MKKGYFQRRYIYIYISYQSLTINLEEINQTLPSKSTVPDPSSSISSIIPSISSLVNLGSSSFRISFNDDTGMYPFPASIYLIFRENKVKHAIKMGVFDSPGVILIDENL